ncbi:MAG: hypothetical protein M1479_05175 [Actinobacteria bacterium]|nr:hypothetical protein [Cyanobacteriota bacterium]MCL5771650.1 hypothetical protein [Actinomycetota bacterium]
MSTKKIYLILLALITVLIFSTAAICNNCFSQAVTSSSEGSTSVSQSNTSGGTGN